MSDKKALKDDQEIVVRQVPFVDHGFSYAQEKLGVAVWKMATGLDGLKARLADAYLELAVLQASDLPPELVEEWKQIKADLTGGKMQYEQRAVGGKMTRLPVGLVPSTLRYMRKKKAHDIACRIHALEAKLDSFTEETSD